MMPTITNIAAYKFAALGDLTPLRTRLTNLCRAWGLKGTILLSSEGINLVVAGARNEIDLLLAELRRIPGLDGLEPKISESDAQPFNRMLVHIKKEIIAFGDARIDPSRYTSKKLPPVELKRWLDEGRDVVLLDTRNDYEVKLGTFRNAVTVELDHFRNFPDAARRLPAELKDRQIVMFCTGGIRCEKAGPFMEREGFAQVYQLEGGILRYFEDCGGDHYDGECFVFDHRVGVNAALEETESDLCFACQTPLTPEELADPRYVYGQSCPSCFVTEAEQMALAIASRHEMIRRITSPLPGSAPYDDRRPVDVPNSFNGDTVRNFLGGILRDVSSEDWRDRFAQSLILGPDLRPVDPDHVVRSGERYHLVEKKLREPNVNPDIRILHEDEAIIVLHKPASIPMRPTGPFHRNTVQHILTHAYHPQKPRACHHLDAETAGVAVFARTRHFAGLIQPQFERGDGTALLSMTGPSHQTSAILPLQRFANRIAFTHPLTKERVVFEAESPEWAAITP